METYADVFFLGGWPNEFLAASSGSNDDDDFAGHGVPLRSFTHCLDEWTDGKAGEVWVHEFVQLTVDGTVMAVHLDANGGIYAISLAQDVIDTCKSIIEKLSSIHKPIIGIQLLHQNILQNAHELLTSIPHQLRRSERRHFPSLHHRVCSRVR